FAAPALRVQDAAGVASTRLVCSGHRVIGHDGGEEHSFELVDQLRPLEVQMRFRTWADEGVIEQWVEVTNTRHAPVTLHEVAAAAPLLVGSDPRLDHFTGDWGAEFTPVHDRLTAGTKVL